MCHAEPIEESMQIAYPLSISPSILSGGSDSQELSTSIRIWKWHVTQNAQIDMNIILQFCYPLARINRNGKVICKIIANNRGLNVNIFQRSEEEYVYIIRQSIPYWRGDSRRMCTTIRITTSCVRWFPHGRICRLFWIYSPLVNSSHAGGASRKIMHIDSNHKMIGYADSPEKHEQIHDNR